MAGGAGNGRVVVELSAAWCAPRASVGAPHLRSNATEEELWDTVREAALDGAVSERYRSHCYNKFVKQSPDTVARRDGQLFHKRGSFHTFRWRGAQLDLEAGTAAYRALRLTHPLRGGPSPPRPRQHTRPAPPCPMTAETRGPTTRPSLPPERMAIAYAVVLRARVQRLAARRWRALHP